MDGGGASVSDWCRPSAGVAGGAGAGAPVLDEGASRPWQPSADRLAAIVRMAAACPAFT